jgi:hypothetical protein
MSVAQNLGDTNVAWAEHFKTVCKPTACRYCSGRRIWWNGTRIRSASIMIAGLVTYCPEVTCRRVKCGSAPCHKSWTLRPEGLTAQRHYQLDVVAEGTTGYLFAPKATLATVAQALNCSRFTVQRWIRWVGQVVTVSSLLGLIEGLSDGPVVPLILDVWQLQRRAKSTKRRQGLVSAATVLCGMEALAQAAGVAPPGLSSVVEAAVDGRYRVTTYADPLIPDFAQSGWWRRHHI